MYTFECKQKTEIKSCSLRVKCIREFLYIVLFPKKTGLPCSVRIEISQNRQTLFFKQLDALIWKGWWDLTYQKLEQNCLPNNCGMLKRQKEAFLAFL